MFTPRIYSSLAILRGQDSMDWAPPVGVGLGRTGSWWVGTPIAPSYHATEVIVVPHEGVEGPQLGPAHTELL